MDFGQIFLRFLHTVALGSVTVFLVLGLVRLRTPRRSSLLISDKNPR